LRHRFLQDSFLGWLAILIAVLRELALVDPSMDRVAGAGSGSGSSANAIDVPNWEDFNVAQIAIWINSRIRGDFAKAAAGKCGGPCVNFTATPHSPL
jgi:hypothetical protein